MAKPHAGAANTPRPRSSSSAKAAANRTSVGSSSSAPPAADLASLPKVSGKRLTYEDDGDSSSSCASAATHPPDLALPEGLADLAPPLDLPDPDAAASSSSVVSAPPLDAIPAPDVSAVSQAAPPSAVTAADAGVEGPTVLTEMEQVLAELRDARGLSTRSRRLLAALAEAAADELTPLRTRRASSFWGKARFGLLAAMVFSVAAMDVALLATFLGGGRSNALPPT